MISQLLKRRKQQRRLAPRIGFGSESGSGTKRGRERHSLSVVERESEGPRGVDESVGKSDVTSLDRKVRDHWRKGGREEGTTKSAAEVRPFRRRLEIG